MKYRVKFELEGDSRPDEERDARGLLELVGDFPWEKEMAAAENGIVIPGLEIINAEENRLLILSAMGKKDEVLFTVESLFSGKHQRGRTGTLINDVPLSRVLNIVTLFSHREYQMIGRMDNSGIYSKALRKMLFLFADDE